MTPKERAYELISKFLVSRDPDGNTDVKHVWAARRCAMITIDYMLENAGFIWGGRDTETGKTARDMYRDHLNEIKQELESEIPLNK